jgi:hypothetical protein
VTAGPAAAAGEVVQLDGPDGTVYVTNAPTDPRYRRMGIAPPPPPPSARGTAAPTAPGRAPSSIGAQLRDGAIGAQIRDAAGRYGLPEELVTAVIRVESGFNPRAVSRKGAQGLMQLMPATASQLGVRDVFDTAENIDGGVRHLRGLIARFENNLALALAAYNAGERAVVQHGGIPPYPETQQYVAQILRIVGSDAAEPVSEEPARTPTYRFVENDGATVYTNIPPRPR